MSTRGGIGLAALLAVLSILAATPYLAAGVTSAYFAGDDFQWLHGASALGWRRAFDLSSRTSSFRPVIDLWFVGAGMVCGRSGACYHLLSLGVHVLNVTLIFALALAVFHDRRIAFLGGAMFALEPAYVQAVAWVAAVPNTLGALFLLASLLAQVRSWTARSDLGRTSFELAAVMLFVGALFSHEGSLTLLAVSAIMWHMFGPSSLTRRPILLTGLVVVACAFTAATYIANRNNPVFLEGGYTVGPHVVRHAFEYLARLHVGPRWWLADTLSVAAIAVLLASSRLTRFGALWLLLALTPYLGFTAGNVSRYHYVPAIGFTLTLAAALVVSYDWSVTRLAAHRVVIRVAYIAVAIFLTGRFAVFGYPAIVSEIRSYETWREYATGLLTKFPHPVDGVIRIDGPTDPAIEHRYVEPMVRWLYRDDDLVVVVEPSA